MGSRAAASSRWGICSPLIRQGQDFSKAGVAVLFLRFVVLYIYAMVFFLEMRIEKKKKTFETCLSQHCQEELWFLYSCGTVCMERSISCFSVAFKIRLWKRHMGWFPAHSEV